MQEPKNKPKPSKRQLSIDAINEMFETQNFAKFGVANPKRNCKKCYGRGYLGNTMAPIGKGLMSRGKIPLPCNCILSYPSSFGGPIKFKPKEDANGTDKPKL